MTFWNRWVLGLCAASALTAACGDGAELASTSESATRGAAFTTFDQTLDGCSPGSTNGINCNHYVCQDRVYINGGPNRVHGQNVLEDGMYYFAVLAPGHQNGGAADGAVGNLSDNVSHGGTDTGSGDTIADRTFTISHGVLSYSGSHAIGRSPNGQRIVGVAPFDVTPNPGGVYILAVCPIRNEMSSASPADCKYDAFKTGRCVQACKPICGEWDPSCVQCPPPECQPTCPVDQWGATDTNCTPCPPPECDPTCDPWSCSNCTPCL